MKNKHVNKSRKLAITLRRKKISYRPLQRCITSILYHLNARSLIRREEERASENTKIKFKKGNYHYSVTGKTFNKKESASRKSSSSLQKGFFFFLKHGWEGYVEMPRCMFFSFSF